MIGPFIASAATLFLRVDPPASLRGAVWRLNDLQSGGLVGQMSCNSFEVGWLCRLNVVQSASIGSC